jgi:hypothetical protein
MPHAQNKVKHESCARASNYRLLISACFEARAQPASSGELDASGFESAHAIEMSPSAAAVRVGLEPWVGYQQMPVRHDGLHMLKALDRFQAPHQLFFEAFHHVVREHKTLDLVMTY